MAREADARLASGDHPGLLAGLPIAFKDLHEAAGLVFTRGSAIYRDTIGATDSVLAERLRDAGALPIAKTNVPEFGLGSHTFNPVWGPTRNPVRPDPQRGRLERRRGRGARHRHAAHRRRQRPGRVAAQPGQLQQRGGAAAHGRPGPHGTGLAAQARLQRERADGSERRRRGAAAGCDGGARSARPRMPDAEAGGAWRSADRRDSAALPRGLVSGPGRTAAGTGGASRAGSPAGHARRRWAATSRRPASTSPMPTRSSSPSAAGARPPCSDRSCPRTGTR